MRHLLLATLIVLGVSAGAAVASGDGAAGTARDAHIMVERGILVFDDEEAANAFAAINMGLPDFPPRRPLSLCHRCGGRPLGRERAAP